MLKVFDNLDGLDFRQLMDVYEQWNSTNGAQQYPNALKNLQVLYAEQDFYHFLREFFSVDGARYFLWVTEGRYRAALRLEPYEDGYLLEALETAPADRQNGYATELVQATFRYMTTYGRNKIYSHIAKDNTQSLSVHRRCGFAIIGDGATFIDGTSHMDYYTLMCEH